MLLKINMMAEADGKITSYFQHSYSLYVFQPTLVVNFIYLPNVLDAILQPSSVQVQKQMKQNKQKQLRNTN